MPRPISYAVFCLKKKIAAELDLVGPGGDVDRLAVVVGEFGAVIAALDPEVAGLDLRLGARDIDGEILALALAGKERVEITLDQADLGILLLGQRVIAHLL